MIAHLFRMVWNRKRWNALILLEIFLSFLVLFAIGVIGFTFVDYYRAPLGFDHRDVWFLRMDYPSQSMRDERWQETMATARQIQGYLRNQQEIQAHALVNTPPYTRGNWRTVIELEGRKVRTNMSFTSLGLNDALDLELAEGRWLNEADIKRKDVKSLVANRRLAQNLFPGESPIGKRFQEDEETFEIVGVLEHFRKEGELRKPLNFGFLALDLDEKVFWLPSRVLLEVTPAADAVFEERLIRDLSRIAEGWSFKVETLTQRRVDYFREETKMLKIAGLVAFFMLAMVALGLIGVLWQQVTRRTVELGVRRAKGATRGRIYTQIAGEFLVVATMALLLGLIAVLQFPIVGFFKEVPTGVLFTAFAGASLVIYLLTVLASLYPGWLATRVNPAEALHYE